MCTVKQLSMVVVRSLVLAALFLPAYSMGQTLSMEELHKKAVAEGGKLSFYGTLAQINAGKVLPAFEKRFPGVKVDHIDATADKLIARAVTEARGGRTFADVFQFNLENLGQAQEQGLVVVGVPPEAAIYPANLQGAYYVATDRQFIVPAWNTNLVNKEEEPTQLEDFARPRWKNRWRSFGRSPLITSSFTRATRNWPHFSSPARGALPDLLPTSLSVANEKRRAS